MVLANKIAIPMPASVLSVENSGQLTTMDAYQDGVGIYTVQQVGGSPISNSEMNELVYKYGADAKATGVEVKAYVNAYGDASEKIKALSIGKFEPMASTVIADGTVCDDGDSLTSNDKYTGGVCSGINTSGVYNDNGTIKCENATVGESLSLDGVSYLVVDNVTIKNNLDRVESICTSKVTTMANVFQNKSTFNSPLNNWDVSNVTNMSHMFLFAINFNQPLDNWDTSNVTDMSYMFYFAKIFNQPLNNWNTSNVTDMSIMFKYASNFNQYIKNWNVSKVTSYSNFRTSSALTTANSPF